MPQRPLLSSMFASPGYSPHARSSVSHPGLVYHNGCLVSGSLDALIHLLIPSADYYPDRVYIFTFLLTSRLFLEPQDVLAQLVHVCLQRQHKGMDVGTRTSSWRILQLLAEWTDTFPYDFLNEETMSRLKEVITQSTVGRDDGLRRTGAQLLQRLLRRLATQQQYEETLGSQATAGKARGPLSPRPGACARDLFATCGDAGLVAQQLTFIELERLSQIGPEELVGAFSPKGSIDQHQQAHVGVKSAKNLEAYVEWFNHLIFLVATEVCLPLKKKQRAKVIEFFIEVARMCFSMGNFNSFMAIISGLSMIPVSRLKKTWTKVKTAKFDILENYMDPSSNFCNYRTALRGAAQRCRNGRSTHEKIVIPYFSLFVKDIYFLNEVCPSRLANGHVNFEKFWELARQVGEFVSWKDVECPFPRDRRVISYLLSTQVLSEDALYFTSYENEGPDNHMDKDRWKMLRSRLLPRT
uniref:ras-GEF domain-containing family member 1B isoform X1 n=1 Tax=Myxine glutinosa TaxID=7769 RepID=UPI00358E8FC3